MAKNSSTAQNSSKKEVAMVKVAENVMVSGKSKNSVSKIFVIIEKNLKKSIEARTFRMVSVNLELILLFLVFTNSRKLLSSA